MKTGSVSFIIIVFLEHLKNAKYKPSCPFLQVILDCTGDFWWHWLCCYYLSLYLSTVLAWFDLSAPFHHLTSHHSHYFFLIWFFFSFLTSLLFCWTHLVEVHKDVHRRSELIGWADSQSASKERATQNPSRQEGTGKTTCQRWSVFVLRCCVDLKFCECPPALWVLLHHWWNLS